MIGHRLGRRQHQVFARLEMLIGGAAVDARQGGHGGDADALEPILGQDRARGLQDHFARARGVTGAAGPDLRHAIFPFFGRRPAVRSISSAFSGDAPRRTALMTIAKSALKSILPA